MLDTKSGGEWECCWGDCWTGCRWQLALAVCSRDITSVIFVVDCRRWTAISDCGVGNVESCRRFRSLKGEGCDKRTGVFRGLPKYCPYPSGRRIGALVKSAINQTLEPVCLPLRVVETGQQILKPHVRTISGQFGITVKEVFHVKYWRKLHPSARQSFHKI